MWQPPRVVIVAVANKLVRIAWAVIAGGENYRGGAAVDTRYAALPRQRFDRVSAITRLAYLRALRRFEQSPRGCRGGVSERNALTGRNQAHGGRAR